MSGCRDSLPVDDDLVDYILRYLPDFNSLLSVILVSKRLYEVYKQRPTFIIKSIAYNQVGPALTSALRLARYQMNRDTLTHDPSEWPSESQVMVSPITAEEASVLARNTRIVSQLEDLFSHRHKDPKSPESMLSEVESFRFCRATYRYWLYADAFRPDFGEDIDPPFENYVEHKETFMSQLSDNIEFCEFGRVVGFLTETIRWVSQSTGHGFNEATGIDSPDEMGFALSSGPKATLQIFKDQSWVPLLDSAEADPWNGGVDEDFNFISYALSVARNSRQLEEPNWDAPDTKIILEENIKYDWPCRACNNTGVAQWSAPNWSLLKGYLAPSILARSMIGNLSRNHDESNELQQYLQRPTITYATLMNWMFDRNEAPGQYGHLSRDDWLCTTCINNFIRLKMHLWWLEQKHTEGMPVPADDCWYGYNCRTQVHKPAHRAKRNHLCAPTRGDPA